ncbi:adenylate kinase-domain-containing protein, partial [Elsinoe ampelina]
IGAPGSGKGTLCLNMSSEYDFVHLSVGDILREAVKKRDALLDWTATMCINIAELIPAEILAAILAKHMDTHKEKGRHRFIIDGFPRDINQVIAVEKAIGDPKFVLLFDCPEDEAKRRYLTRRLEGRDDTEALFDKRFAEFKDKLGPIVAYYQLEGKIMTVRRIQSVCEPSFANIGSG